VTQTPIEQHCPYCGAPLELDEHGNCHWCHEPITIIDSERSDVATGALHDGLSPEQVELIAKVERHDQLNLPDGDVFLPLPVFPLLACLNTAAYDPAVQGFLTTPGRVEAVRALATSVQAAGHRLQDANVPEDDVVQRGEKIYTVDELWTFELLADLLVQLENIGGIERDTRTSIRESVSAHDDLWQKRVRKALKKAGDGPEQFQTLREAIPHRH
jgi:hypothetical protein